MSKNKRKIHAWEGELAAWSTLCCWEASCIQNESNQIEWNCCCWGRSCLVWSKQDVTALSWITGLDPLKKEALLVHVALRLWRWWWFDAGFFPPACSMCAKRPLNELLLSLRCIWSCCVLVRSVLEGMLILSLAYGVTPQKHMWERLTKHISLLIPLALLAHSKINAILNSVFFSVTILSLEINCSPFLWYVCSITSRIIVHSLTLQGYRFSLRQCLFLLTRAIVLTSMLLESVPRGAVLQHQVVVPRNAKCQCEDSAQGNSVCLHEGSYDLFDELLGKCILWLWGIDYFLENKHRLLEKKVACKLGELSTPSQEPESLSRGFTFLLFDDQDKEDEVRRKREIGKEGESPGRSRGWVVLAGD